MEKYFKNNEPKVNSYDNGIILPSKIVENGPMWGLGGACDSDNNFISDSLYDGDGLPMGDIIVGKMKFMLMKMLFTLVYFFNIGVIF